MVKIACLHGGDNSYIYKDNWNMQEEVQFVIQAIHDWQIKSSISRKEMCECKFYESIDQLWHQVGTVMKHVTTSTNDMELPQFENNNELLKK